MIVGVVVAVSVAVNPVTVSGWNTNAVTTQTGQRLSDRVRVRPRGRHTLRLQVAPPGGDTWRGVWKGTTDRRGRAAIRLPALAEGRWKVRLAVPATRTAGATMTAVRRVRVMPAPVTPRSSVPDPTPTPTPDSQPSTTVYVAGDIGLCPPAGTPDKTAALVDAPVVVPGDLAYPAGTTADFAKCYDPYWGPLKDRTYPVPGNHEYYSGAAAYFAYFGARVGTLAAPWYTIDFGTWRFYMLNSNCAAVGGCGPGSAQYTWISRQLAQPQPRCTAAVWHHPRWSSGQHGPATEVADLYALLASQGADLLLTGHEHNYERFGPMTAAGDVAADGIRQFVVGTGGQTMRPFAGVAKGSQVRLNDSTGVLKMTLSADTYTWDFLPTTPGAGTDSGSDICR